MKPSQGSKTIRYRPLNPTKSGILPQRLEMNLPSETIITSSSRSRYPSESLILHFVSHAWRTDGDKEPITSWQCQETHLPRVRTSMSCRAAGGESYITAHLQMHPVSHVMGPSINDVCKVLRLWTSSCTCHCSTHATYQYSPEPPPPSGRTS